MKTATKKPVEVPESETLEEKFQRLASAWQDGVAHLSSSTKRENYPAYREIITLGAPVIPVLLRDLERTQRHWFTALRVISGENPVPEGDAGDIPKMVDAWIK